jgi:carbamoyl-phosphate synthase small subunit
LGVVFFLNKMKKTKLVLESGETFAGHSPSWQEDAYFGEVVFTTGMTGYIESLTDPSFAGQILTFTYPLIGNYGVPDKDLWESSKIHAAGVVVSELAPHYSHSTAKSSLEEWLHAQKVPIIYGVDTRALTRSLRSKGVAEGAITDENKRPRTFPNTNKRDLVAEVSCEEPITYGKGKKTIIAVDCGIKENIIRHLCAFDWTVKRVPFDYDFTKEKYDGLFLSNGPGDPKMCKKTIAHLQTAMGMKKPIFGICLGSQLLALAAGATTYKLRFGHRGQNQPTIEPKTGKCFLTSQNHGYAVNEKTLPKDWEVTFRHLNDDTVSGICHKKLPYFAVQFHPEANPGPVDTEWLFQKFYEAVK